MAKRTTLNPESARKLERDIDDIVQGSGSAIDAVYDEYKELNRETNQLEDIQENLRENEAPIPRELRIRLAENKIRIRELDRRIAQYTKIMLKRIRDRMEIVKASPGASFNRPAIREVERAIFKVDQKAKRKGADVRTDIGRIMGAVMTLEQDSGIFIQKPGKKIDATSRRRAEEAEIYAALVEQWKKVYKHAKKDPRVQEDIEWVSAQIKGLDTKFRRGESIRRGLERVAKRIKDIHNRTKPRQRMKSYADAKKGVGDFVVVIQEYAQSGDATSAGVDRLKRELEDFSRQFPSSAKSQWSRSDQRQFATDISNLRKALDALRPKGRKKNPCIGLHFHGKDTDDLLKALEKSAERVEASPSLRRAAKGNPRGLKKGVAPKVLPKDARHMWKSVFDAAYEYYREDRKATEKQAEEIAARTAWDEVKRYYVKRSGKWTKRKKALPQVDRPHEVRIGNPLEHIPARAGVKKIRKVVSDNISTEMAAGKPQKQAIAIAIRSAQEDAERIGGTTGKLILSEYPRRNPSKKSKRRSNPEISSYAEFAHWLNTLEAASAVNKRELSTGEKLQDLAEACEEEAYGPCTPAEFRKAKAIIMRQSNPKGASKKMAPSKGNTRTPESKRLIDRCQQLWDEYCKRPTKKRLRAVLEHLEKMKESSSKTVKGERSRCLRVAKKEAKRLKV